jgi:hypothetical protein
VLLMATSAAHAYPVALPDAMLGSWCPASAAETNEMYVRAETECPNGKTIFWPTGYDEYEHTCRYISVRKSENPGVYRIVARCTGSRKPESWVESFDASMYNDELNIANRKRHDGKLNDLARWYV